MKRILILIFLSIFSFTPISSLTYDFNVGIGVGVQSSSLLFPYRDNDIRNIFFPLESITNPDWVLHKDIYSFKVAVPVGIFFGGGITFETRSPQSIGLEYSLNYLYDKAIYGNNYYFHPAGGGKYSGSNEYHYMEITGSSLQHNLDFYYKLQFSKMRTMAFQFNLGLAMVNPYAESSYEIYNNYGSNSTILNKTTYYSNLIGLGLHTSARFNFSMFYMQLDYRYIPVYLYKGRSTDSRSGDRTSNQVGFSIGVLFNKGILDVWSNKDKPIKEKSNNKKPKDKNYEELERLFSLFERGALTQEEYDREKNKILTG